MNRCAVFLYHRDFGVYKGILVREDSDLYKTGAYLLGYKDYDSVLTLLQRGDRQHFKIRLFFKEDVRVGNMNEFRYSYENFSDLKDVFQDKLIAAVYVFDSNEKWKVMEREGSEFELLSDAIKNEIARLQERIEIKKDMGYDAYANKVKIEIFEHALAL